MPKKSPPEQEGLAMVVALHSRVRVEQLLELSFFFVALKSFHNFSAFENKDRGNCSDAVLNSQLHVLRYVDLANFGFAFVISCQLVNDWTQSFARASAFRVKVNQYGAVRAEYISVEAVSCKFCRHFVS